MLNKYLMRYILVGGLGLLALPATSFAQQQGYTNAPVNLFAGPASDYPVVAQLQGGTPLTVMGCVSGYSWCDVALPNLRGWIYGGSISYPYQGANVPILTYGLAIGLPIVTFSIGSYWGNYYRGRPWYGNQSHYRRRPGRPAIGGRPPGYRPPGYRPPAHRPPSHARPPGNRPGGPGYRPPGNARPPGNRPPSGGTGHRPPGGGGHGASGGGHGGGGGGHGGGGRPPERK